ncbi:protease III [Escherichia coli]|uniref:Protease III n=1 Tax=Escherichia coli TaxID=562 RepID=A0A376UGK9_ECOLX|nr:protease III [Escherichia coli]
MSVGRQWGMGFLLQSNDKQPSFLWERYKAFFPTAEAKLRAMKPDEFAQIQQAVITQMLQAPQTLGEEASKLSKDFDRGNMRFDSRDKIVAQIKLLTPAKTGRFLPSGGSRAARHGYPVADFRQPEWESRICTP